MMSPWSSNGTSMLSNCSTPTVVFSLLFLITSTEQFRISSRAPWISSIWGISRQSTFVHRNQSIVQSSSVVRLNKSVLHSSNENGPSASIATSTDDNTALQPQINERKGQKRREKRWRRRMIEADVGNSFRVCFDCAFDSKLSSKEANSLAMQLAFSYGVNNKSHLPVYIDICGVERDGQTRGHLEKVQGFPDRWAGRALRCFEEGLEEVYGQGIDNGEDVDDNNDDAKGYENELGTTDADTCSNSSEDEQFQPYFSKVAPNHQFVYLTGDSPNVLSTLENNTTYIIGGIVDRNRLKRAAINRAKSLNSQHPSLNVTTARLPLDEHIDFKESTRILTCNHVFEILLRFRENEYTDWKMAIMTVLPHRKDLEEKNE